MDDCVDCEAKWSGKHIRPPSMITIYLAKFIHRLQMQILQTQTQRITQPTIDRAILIKKNHFFSLVKSIQFRFLSMIDERFIIGVIYSPTALEQRWTSFIYHNKLHELFSIFFCEETKRQKTIVSPLRLTAVYSLIFLCLFLFRCRFVAHLLIEFDRTEQTQ